MSERETPYPTDTRAKGWRFELDLEQIDQSDTWALTPLDMRPWLLMLWATAWRQTPCGSLPADDALVAVRIGMKSSVFAKNRSVLMRGWWKAIDGRLYHDTIVKRVLEMLEARNKERDRKAEYRKRKEAEEAETTMRITMLSRGTDLGLHSDNVGTDDTGTGTGTNSKPKPPIPPVGGLSENVQAKAKKRNAVAFQTFLDACRASGEKAIPDGDTVFAYADETGIPIEFLRLHWLEFKERYTGPDAKRYKDWRSVYRKSVRGCWFKLWYLRGDGTCGLTTQGEQAKRHHGKDES